MTIEPPTAGDDAVPAARRIEQLNQAATDLDQWATSEIVVDVLRTWGVVAAWTNVLAPALRLRGVEYDRTANGINVEHLLSECTRAGLSALAWGRGARLRGRPVLLAAPEGEQHVLSLYALAAALSEAGLPSVLLGASVPQRALSDSAAQLSPAAVFLWSSAPGTAREPDLDTIRRDHEQRRDDAPPVAVLGGPGWSLRSDHRVDDLAAALQACSEPTVPSRHFRRGLGSTGRSS